MSIEANLAKAEADDQSHNLGNLRTELADEKGKRQEAESEAVKLMGHLEKLMDELKSLKAKFRDGGSEGTRSSADHDEMVKVRSLFYITVTKLTKVFSNLKSPSST
jgi:predicted  nucleic acid-binding Zn-ribbon protein